MESSASVNEDLSLNNQTNQNHILEDSRDVTFSACSLQDCTRDVTTGDFSLQDNSDVTTRGCSLEDNSDVTTRGSCSLEDNSDVTTRGSCSLEDNSDVTTRSCSLKEKLHQKQNCPEEKQEPEEQHVSMIQQQEQENNHLVPEKPHSPEPPDGGWGWVVAAGVFLIALVVPMLSPSFGILFSPQLLEWQVSSTTVAVIYSAFMVVWKLTGVIVGSLAREFGFRKVAMTGTLLTASCLTFSAFATSPVLLFVFFSLGCGLGNGLSCVGYLILAQYFQRHRGLANTCLMAGAGLGHFISPLLIRLLQDKYGFKGATMIIGVIILHGFVGAALFHPVEWHQRGSQRKASLDDSEDADALVPEPKNSGDRSLRGGGSSGFNTQLGKLKKPKFLTPTYLQNVNGCKDTIMSFQEHESLTSDKADANLCDLPFANSSTQANDKATSAERGVNCICAIWSTIIRVVCSVINDIRILRHPSCLIIALASTLVVNGEANFTVLVPFAIQDAGHSLETAALCISVAGICNFITRLCVSALSDFPWFRMRLCYMTAIATLGISIIVFTLQTKSGWQVGLMGVIGCAIGTFFGLSNLLITQIVGLSNLTSMYGAKNFLGALGFFSVGPLIGMVRDASGSYLVSMWVLAAITLASFLSWFTVPVSINHDCRRTAQKPSVKFNI